MVSARPSTLDIPVPSAATDASNLRDITRACQSSIPVKQNDGFN